MENLLVQIYILILQTQYQEMHLLEHGGIIVLGVSEKKGSFKVEGLDNDQIQKIQKNFWNAVNKPETVNVNLLKNEDVSVVVKLMAKKY